ncbi:MAG: TadG family pilus assembly protein [Pseudomonadota bacterium]|uniref:TadG family pilus assembly protein n=1 Tax=Ralstonia pickettii TaxID=329 RepID=UPI00271535CE|nr:TadG family pilus assembly protein [Ralstonia pickettii]MEE2976883.1 TadG family pilus assembly protein [Pseudomonadota bacterium]WKZ88258.1 pilus assembly protein TadG-related protein [Ralstonia pickettii]
MLTAIFIVTVGMAVLVSVDIGNLFFSQRALQRTADMAAMAAAQRLDDAQNAAQQSVTQNGLGMTPTVDLGTWDATNTVKAPSYFCQAATDANCTGDVNAARVTLAQNVPYFFSFGTRTLTASAIAKNTPMVGFSVGSGLLALNNGLLNQLLGALLHTSLNLSAVAYQGLATTSIRLGDLMTALNVGTVQELLALSPRLGDLYAATLSVASQSALAGAYWGAPGASNALSVGSDLNIPISIGDGGAGTPGLLQLQALTGNEQAALDTQLNVLSLLTTAAQIANGQSAIAINALNLNLLGLGAVGLSLKIIQPPVIGIGPPGQFISGPSAGQWRTQARTAQVALGLNINVGVPYLVSVNLPTAVTVAGAQAHVKSASCAIPRSSSTATISVQPQPASVCIAQNAYLDVMQSAFNCSSESPAPLLNLIGLGAVSIKANLSQTPSAGWTDVTIAASQINQDPQTDTGGNSPPRGGTPGFFSSILNTNVNQLQLTLLGLPLGDVGKALVAPILITVGSLLDSILSPVLEVLGIQLGYADIKLLSLDCDAVELVY